MRIIVRLVATEPGRHFLRTVIGVIDEHVVDIPREECEECRPDFGEYLPIVTYTAIERALRARGEMQYVPGLGYSREYTFGIHQQQGSQAC